MSVHCDHQPSDAPLTVQSRGDKTKLAKRLSPHGGPGLELYCAYCGAAAKGAVRSKEASRLVNSAGDLCFP
jgi:hypothetical protein